MTIRHTILSSYLISAVLCIGAPISALADTRAQEPKLLAPQAIPVTPPAQAAVRELRRHWATVRTDGTLLQEVTSINTNSEELSATVAIIRDAKGQSWHFADVYDFARQGVRYEITHLPTGEFVKLTYKIPLQAKTRTEALLEAHRQKNQERSVRNQDAVVTIATRLASRTAPESEWNDLDKSAEWRSTLRTSLSTAFLDAVEQMRDTLIRHDDDLASFVSLTRLLSYAPQCEPASRDARVVQMWPDCDFDKDLGMPCSKEQAARVDRAVKKGVMPSRY